MRHTAINNLYSNVSSQVNDKAYDLKGDLVEIDEDKVAKEVKRLQAEYDSKSYARAREPQYPSITDVVVALAEKQEGDDTMWKEITALRAKVKSENPKPT